MLTEQSFSNYIESLGYRPACPPICVPKINKLSQQGQVNFEFYNNPHNLCWFVSGAWKSCNPELIDQLFTLNLRDFKLLEIL